MNEVEHRGFERSVQEYTEALDRFVNLHGLGWPILAQPDHLAIKCLDSEHYEETVAAWLPDANEASAVRMNGRRLASIRLMKPLDLASFGTVEWLEIMEPRPMRVGKDIVGVDHVEFLAPNPAKARIALNSRDVEYKVESNRNHSWLSVIINALGQELKFTNRSLADMTADGLQNGKGKLL